MMDKEAVGEIIRAVLVLSPLFLLAAYVFWTEQFHRVIRIIREQLMLPNYDRPIIAEGDSASTINRGDSDRDEETT